MRTLITVTPPSQTLLRENIRSPYAPPLHDAFGILLWIYRDVTFALESNDHIKEILNTPSYDCYWTTPKQQPNDPLNVFCILLGILEDQNPPWWCQSWCRDNCPLRPGFLPVVKFSSIPEWIQEFSLPFALLVSHISFLPDFCFGGMQYYGKHPPTQRAN